MAMERISSERGLVLPDRVLAADIGLIAIVGVDAGRATLETLEAGAYDITPKVWTKNLYTHLFEVNPDGTGIYRGVPKDDEVGTFDPNHPELGFHEGGRVIRVPEDQEGVVVIGPKAGVRKIHLFELILYHP